ncbi:hypothetical protein M405DRAFT_156387 [Rhizopogon salebrosus TDB-379]|nr:hypothetical protein M405DRAFT_156387 [Rhizopogon salebrosus TDB-379]
MKMNGLNVWYFDAIVQSFPMLLQFSLLLFGISISADIWYKQHSVAWVLIATVAFGILFYALAILASLSSVACPYQTPLSAVLRLWGVDTPPAGFSMDSQECATHEVVCAELSKGDTKSATTFTSINYPHLYCLGSSGIPMAYNETSHLPLHSLHHSLNHEAVVVRQTISKSFRSARRRSIPVPHSFGQDIHRYPVA